MSQLAVGLMSGTSADGVDAALVGLADGPSVELVEFHFEPYQESDRHALLKAPESCDARTLTILHTVLGRRFADAAENLLEKAGVDSSQVSFVSSHGHTLWHEPGRSTLQLGDPAQIAERLALRVVSDFRSRDIAAGGQGAPLVPIADACLFGAEEGGRILLNIGGMANLTFVPRLGDLPGVVAFDTGPGMAIVDQVYRTLRPGDSYDRGGETALGGSPVADVVDDFLTDDFFSQAPPKSTGRERFGGPRARVLVEELKHLGIEAEADYLATAVEITARSVVMGISRWVPGDWEDILVSGGGIRNRQLHERLAELQPGWSWRRFEDEFFDGDAKEAVAFAFLGWLTLQAMPGNLPAATGASGPRVLGRITPA